MKKLILKLLCLFFLFSGGIPEVISQDRNNEDKVIKLDPQMSRFNSVPNELLVKFKDAAIVQMSKVGPSKIISGISAVDRVLSQYDLEEVEQLLPNDNPKRLMRSARAYSGQTITETNLNQLYRVKVKTGSAKTNFQLIEELKATTEVEFAELNYIASVVGQPEGKVFSYPTITGKANNTSTYAYSSDPMYSLQWGIPAVKLDVLWQKPIINSKRPVIAIIDTGVDTEHPDLKANIWTNPGELDKTEGYDDDNNGFIDDLHGWDFVNQTGIIKDFNSHGTHCAGIAAAVGDNGIGITGANPNAFIMPVTVMQSDGTGDVATIIKGIHYAAINGADVISMSFGTYAYSIALEQALAQAYQTCILVAAAGNDGIALYKPCSRVPQKESQLFPAAFSFVLGVQASQQSPGEYGYLTSWSNYDCDGPVYSAFGEENLYNYELTAPGASIISTVPGGQYRSYNGTSMATPLVAGGISSLKQRKNISTQEILWATLIHSASNNVDFNAAYSFVPKPELNIVAIETNDTLMGDKDMRPDAGETIQIYPTIRNTGGEVDSIYFSLGFAEFEDTTLVKIYQDSIGLGYNLSSYAKMKSKNPLTIKIKSTVVDGRNIKMVMKSWYGSKHQGEVSQNLILNVENGVEIKGMIMHDMTLYPNVYYIVSDNLAVASGVTLTIKPGTVLKFKDDVLMASAGTIKAIGKIDSLIVFTKTNLGNNWRGIIFSSSDSLKYCRFEYITKGTNDWANWTGLTDCEISNCNFSFLSLDKLSKCNILFNQTTYSNGIGNSDNCNILYNKVSFSLGLFDSNSIANSLRNSNIFCNFGANYYNTGLPSGETNFSIYNSSTTPQILIPVEPQYHGSSVESIARKGICDFYTPKSGIFGVYDLSNRLLRPSSLAHGLVWKVVVDGSDAQDEFNLLPPLGVGKHKFEVYFNRPMNKAFPPMIAMGVRLPYTQNAIGEDGSWNETGDIYTAYQTIKGSSTEDGLNRIYVANAKDNENFEIPFEDMRFNVIVQAAGSMSNGFEATPGLGKVNLKWETPDGYFDDLLGYNMYRYTYNQGVSSDTVLVNSALIADTVFTDFNVVPGTTYNYMYKVLRTDLTENDFSKVVSTTPLTAIKGDANGDLKVNVLDITSIVAYLLNYNPQPFIFDAADVNSDGTINVLDIVGVVNLVLNGPKKVKATIMDQQASLYMEKDTLFADTNVPVGGIQFDMSGISSIEDIQTLKTLEGFESGYSIKNDTLRLLYYSMSGKSIPAGTHIPLLVMKTGSKIVDAIFGGTNGSPIRVNFILTNIGNISNNMNQSIAELGQNIPNPFNGQTIIPIHIYEPVDEAVVRIVNMMGQEVEVMRLSNPYIGVHLLSWNSDLNKGLFVYTLEIRTNKQKQVCPVKKMIVQ